ncbi:MAG TPA: hypothetical protein VIX59_02410 [Candidatus Binataceae bacterium]
MAQIIDFAEIQAARRRPAGRAAERDSLERAVQVLRENLAATATLLVDAAPAEHEELLRRVEHFTALIRYGMRMLGYGGDAGLDSPARARPE